MSAWFAGPLFLLCLTAASVAQQAGVLKPGDTVIISFPSLPAQSWESRNEYTILDSGGISLPLLERALPASGISCTQLSRRVEAAYRTADINPGLSVQVALGGPQWAVASVTVEGEVASPGEFPLRPGMTLMGLVSRAGGFRNSITKRKTIKLYRSGQVLEYDIRRIRPDGSNNPLLKAGDRIVLE